MHHIEITVLIMGLLIAGGFLFYRMERRRTSDLIHKNIELEQEVTERRRAEEALLESEGKLAGIVDSVTDLMIMVDNQFNIIWANDIAKNLFGRDMVGKKCHSIYHGRDTVCQRCIVKKCFEDGWIHEFGTEITGTDGSLMNFWCTANVAARHEDGSPKMVVEFLRDLTESKRSAMELTELKQQIEFILGATNTGIDIIDSEFNIQYIDPEWGKIYGDPTGRKCYEYFMDRSKMCPDCGIPQALKTKEAIVTEEVLVREGNRQIQVTTRPFQNEKGEWLVAEVNVDITERKQAEEEIKKSLREKEVLLREIHHRVKNNMQVISSLLKLQSKYIKDEDDAEMFKESQNRIKSMALVHEKLYQSEGLANIDFKEYIKHLTDMLVRSYGMNTGEITLSIDVEDAAIEIDSAIPCGLIVNELVSNSLKHAFPEVKNGAIKISLHSIDDNEMELTISDNGVGMPEKLDYTNVDSLGLKLVNILTKQIDGSLTMDRGEGTVFRIRFSKQKEVVQS
jgi:PAS domain S-box-containing protein